MISLRFKLSGYFFLSGLAILLIMRWSAPALLRREFINDARENHYKIYTDLIEEFIQSNGQWGTPEAAEAFFMALNRNNHPQFLSEGEFPEDLPPSEKEPEELSSPPLYSIGLSDMNGNTLIPFKGYEPAERVPDRDLLRGDVIFIDGTLMAYAFPDGTPSIREEDKLILDRLNSIIALGFNASLLIALVSGLILGTQLTSTIRKLTDAAESLKAGLDGQQITGINSRDEIGKLAEVINEMSLELAASHNRIKELAIRDELTGLYNRRFFNHEMEVITANAKRHNHTLSIVLGDVDFFKKVNDNFSHQTGDEVLRQLSSLMRKGVREGDIVARYGGEEIILALPETDMAEALSTIERLRVAIEQYDWNSVAQGLSITMSFGICSETGPESYEVMSARADENLYKAKKNGRNRSVASSAD